MKLGKRREGRGEARRWRGRRWGGGGSLKEDPSNWRSRIFPEHRETLPRLPGPGNLFASFTGAKNFFPSKFRKRCSAWRRGEGVDPLSPFP